MLSNPRLLAVAALCFVLTGCAVGPKYQPPVTKAPPTYKESPANPQANQPAPQQAPGEDPTLGGLGNWTVAQPSDAMLRGKWWEVYNDPELNALEEQLNINNQNIRIFFENYMAARALVRQARSQYYPTVTAGFNYSRSASTANAGRATTGAARTTGSTGTTSPGTTPGTTTPGTSTPGTTTPGTTTPGSTRGGAATTTTTVASAAGGSVGFFDIPFGVSWEPDLFGRIRNTVRSEQYSAQVSAADLENERLIEQASLASFFFEIRGQDALLAILNSTVASYQQALDITRTQYATGLTTELSVIQAQNALENAQSQATNVGIARAQFEHAIATLIGKAASEFSIPVKAALVTPPPIPIGLPSQLLERRPDIAGAERRMAAANAQIGVAYAAYYPNVGLSAAGGLSSSSWKHLFDWPSRFWSVGPAVSQTIYDGGLRRARVNQFIAQYNAELASYRQTVLTAFQQVEDALSTLRILTQQIQQQRQVVESAKRATDIEMTRYKLGLDPYINVVTEQTLLLGAQQNLALLEIQRMTASVALIEALGGGWDRSQLPTPQQVTAKPASTETQIQR